MRTRLIFALMGSMICLSSASPQDKHALTRQEVVALLPRGYDGSPEDQEKFRTLLDAGERAYPAMAEMLLDGSEPNAIWTIIPVFIQSTGDKSLPIEAMKEYIEDETGLVPPSGAVPMVIAALGEIGGVQEAEFMRKYLNFDDPIIRHSFEGNLAILEKRLDAEKKSGFVSQTDRANSK